MSGSLDPCITEVWFVACRSGRLITLVSQVVDMKKLPLALEKLEQRHLRGKTILRFEWQVG
jgi:hypothetical protein